MKGKKGAGVQWRHTSVVIRADIYAKVHDRGINISDECNRALADLVGIDYSQQQLPEEVPFDPVIITSEQIKPPTSDSGTGKKSLRPVINADDPATPAEVLQLKKDRISRPIHPEPATAPAPAHTGPDIPARQKSAQSRRRIPEKERKPPLEKKARGNVIKRFVSARVMRTDAGEGGESSIAKDEMYQLFVRWCRAHSVSPIPDRRSFGIALKNRFVIGDATINGIPSWVNIKVK